MNPESHTKLERFVDVPPAPASGEADLWRRPPPASQNVGNRDAEVSSQGRGLVETTTPYPERMEGHRDDDIGTVEQVASGGSHEGSERMHQRATSLVLERVDDQPQRSAVVPRSSTTQWRLIRGRHAATGVSCDPRGAGTHGAAPAADGWRDQLYSTPAVRAHDPRVGSSSVESHTAHRDAQSSARTPSQSVRSLARLGDASWRGARAPSRGRCELESFGAPPEALEVVEPAGLFGKRVDDAVEAVNEDPLGVLVSFDV